VASNPPAESADVAIVYSSRYDDVTHTIVGGQIVLDNREVVGIDEDQVVARFTEHALALRDRSR